MLHDNVVAHRQSEPRAFTRGLGGKKRIEYFFFHLCRNAVVTDPDLYGIAQAFGRSANDRLEPRISVFRLITA